MSFTIERRTQTVYACNDCGWCQIKKNSITNDQELACGLCKGPANPNPADTAEKIKRSAKDLT